MENTTCWSGSALHNEWNQIKKIITGIPHSLCSVFLSKSGLSLPRVLSQPCTDWNWNPLWRKGYMIIISKAKQEIFYKVQKGKYFSSRWNLIRRSAIKPIKPLNNAKCLFMSFQVVMWRMPFTLLVSVPNVPLSSKPFLKATKTLLPSSFQGKFNL